jgi:hypothetical protein
MDSRPPPSHVPLDSLVDENSVPQWGDDDLRAMLRHQLDAVIEAEFGEHAPDLARRLPLRPGERFRDALLRDADPQIEVLSAIKDFGKWLGKDRASGLPPQIGKVIYFSAIAAAELRCARRITDLDNDALRKGLRWGRKLPWVDPAIAELLHLAERSLPRPPGSVPS